MYIHIGAQRGVVRSQEYSTKACTTELPSLSFTLISRWSRRRAVGGVIGLGAIGGGFGGITQHRLGGGGASDS